MPTSIKIRTWQPTLNQPKMATETKVPNIVKVRDLLIIVDRMYDIAYEHGDASSKAAANKLLSIAIDVSNGGYYTTLNQPKI